jgi:hypothetical protein
LLIKASEIQYNGASTQVLQMNLSSGHLYLTGRPFGFMDLAVSANPESPTLVFSIATMIDSFTTMLPWVVDWHAAGSLAVSGSMAVLSGSVGVSGVSMASPNQPREKFRLPTPNENQDVPVSDPNFTYAASVAVGSTHFGFRQQDYVVTSQISANTMSIISMDSYVGAGQTLCCVTDAAFFANQVFVAFGDRLVWFTLSNGRLAQAFEALDAQPTALAATSQYLYFYQPSRAASSGQIVHPAGIYAVDTTGAVRGFFASGNIKKFAVNAANDHLYAVDQGSDKIDIYRMQWQNH